MVFEMFLKKKEEINLILDVKNYVFGYFVNIYLNIKCI